MLVQTLIPTLDDGEASLLQSLCAQKKAPAGTVLCSQGDDKRDIFFITTGQVGIYRALSLGGKITAVKIATVTNPLMVGEMNFFSAQTRNASILAEGPIEYLQLTPEKIQELESKHPSLSIKVLKYAGSMTAERYSNFIEKFERKLLSEARTIHHAKQVLDLMMDKVTICKPEVAKKLFDIHFNFHGEASR